MTSVEDRHEEYEGIGERERAQRDGSSGIERRLAAGACRSSSLGPSPHRGEGSKGKVNSRLTLHPCHAHQSVRRLACAGHQIVA